MHSALHYSISLFWVHCHRHPPSVHRCVEFTATEYPSASSRPCHHLKLKLSLKHTFLSVSTLNCTHTQYSNIIVHCCLEFTASGSEHPYTVHCCLEFSATEYHSSLSSLKAELKTHLAVCEYITSHYSTSLFGIHCHWVSASSHPCHPSMLT